MHILLQTLRLVLGGRSRTRRGKCDAKEDEGIDYHDIPLPKFNYAFMRKLYPTRLVVIQRDRGRGGGYTLIQGGL